MGGGRPVALLIPVRLGQFLGFAGKVFVKLLLFLGTQLTSDPVSFALTSFECRAASKVRELIQETISTPFGNSDGL